MDSIKHTKIVATISDKHCEPEFLQELYDAGMNVVRINTAHQTTDTALKIVNNVRAVCDVLQFLLTLKGLRSGQKILPIRLSLKPETTFS